VCEAAGLEFEAGTVPLWKACARIRNELGTRNLRLTTITVEDMLADLGIGRWGPFLAAAGVSIEAIRGGRVRFDDLARLGLPLGPAMKLRHGYNLLARKLASIREVQQRGGAPTSATRRRGSP